MATRTHATRVLNKLGVPVIGGLVKVSDLHRVFGASMPTTDWVVARDFPNVEISPLVIDTVANDLLEKGIVLFPQSITYNDFGIFVDRSGEEARVLGLVYQYSLAGNPRNVNSGFHLFHNGITKNSGFGLTAEDTSKQSCYEAARELIETELFDF